MGYGLSNQDDERIGDLNEEDVTGSATEDGEFEDDEFEDEGEDEAEEA